MSGYATHMLIGAAGGLALVRGLETTGMGTTFLHATGIAEPTLVRDIGFMVASGLLATWPDIDEPGSFISRRVRWTMSLLVGLLLAIATGILWGDMHAQFPPIIRGGLIGSRFFGAMIGWCVGLFVGGYFALVILRGIRALAGGHRRLTHSLVLGGILLLSGRLLWWGGATWIALIPVALAWGQLLHVLGDVVTPSGVPLFWPISTAMIRVLPKSISGSGEIIIGTMAALGLLVLISWK